MTKRVAFTGAQGVGKSTTAVALRQQLSGRVSATVVSGIGADVARLGLPVGSAASTDTLAAFAALHLQRERIETEGLVIFDRCLLDLIAYARVTNCPRSFLGLLRECAAWSLPRFDRIYLVPIEAFSRRTSVERESDEFRASISEAVSDEGVAMGIELVRLQGSVLERVSQIMSDLGVSLPPVRQTNTTEES